MEQVLLVPEYVASVKISNSRRPTYYKEGSSVPKKYSDINRYEFRTKRFKNFNKKLLYDKQEKEFVIKNKAFIDKPRILTIGGNMIYTGMGEHIRMKIIEAIKDNFRPYVQRLNKIEEFPIQIDAHIHCLPRMRNWDIDNLWIYIKSFQDLLIECDIIPDDSVRYITKAPSFEYFPVKEDSDRKMVFRLRPDTRTVTSHVMFNSKKVPITEIKGQYKTIEPVIHLSLTEISPGSAVFEKNELNYKVTIGVGKRKLLYNKLADGLKTLRYWAFQYNSKVVIDSNSGTEYSNYDSDLFRTVIEKYLSKEGISVIIHNL